MLVNWKRMAFILATFVFYSIDLLTDIWYTLTIHDQSYNIALFSILLLQPCTYFIYFWLTLILPVVCKDSEESFPSFFLSILYKPVLFTILCELKLMLSPLSLLINRADSNSDQIKHNFLSQIITHTILESIPMSILQATIEIQTESLDEIGYLSPSISILAVVYGVFVLNIFKRMNTGGLAWIQKPKPTLQFYSMNQDALINHSYLNM